MSIHSLFGADTIELRRRNEPGISGCGAVEAKE
jgi:hypothetical protein